MLPMKLYIKKLVIAAIHCAIGTNTHLRTIIEAYIFVKQLIQVINFAFHEKYCKYVVKSCECVKMDLYFWLNIIYLVIIIFCMIPNILGRKCDLINIILV